jgi:hypothetical protein
MTQVTGRAYISLSGVRVASKEGATLDIGGTSKEGVAADHGVAGWQGSTAIPSIECTLLHTDDSPVTLEQIRDFSGNVTFQTDTNKTWILRDAWHKGIPKLTSKGEISAVFEGMTAEAA